jgi:hypothetical protein
MDAQAPPAIDLREADPGDDDNPPAPLSNPPPDHKLTSFHYDSLDDLTDDLHEWAAQALFGVYKMRTLNVVKDFGATRVDFGCLKGPARVASQSVGLRSATTAKRDCPWEATAKALLSTGRKWSFAIKPGRENHNHPPFESSDDISLARRFNATQKAFIDNYTDRPAISNREIAHALRKQFPGIIFTKRQLRNTMYILRKNKLDGYNPFQATMKMLNERGVYHTVLWSVQDPNKPEGLFWTEPWCEQQWKM